MKMKFLATGAAGVLLLGACTTMPTGPSVTVLPGTGKNFDQFRFDDQECRQFANGQVGGNTQRTLQHRYDIGYQQCMYAKGHRVPVAGRFESTRPAPAASAYTTPPPPLPGTPPPPPPR
jgi:hypothetical protein